MNQNPHWKQLIRNWAAIIFGNALYSLAVALFLEPAGLITGGATGIAFIVPVSSIGGKRALLFLTEHQTLELKEESTLKDTRYDLLLVIANQGYTGSIMDAARAAGAGGGTVIHAKGTGMEGAAKFMGIDLVNEKELVLIVSRTSEKNAIMKAIMDNADKKAGSIVFSLPVTDTAGLRLLDEE